MVENRPHILVVDDDEKLRDLLRKYLTENGFWVTVATDTRAARQQLGLFEFDLMVLDVMMPGETGMEFLGKEKSLPPVLLLTARGEPMERVEGLEAGADDYLAKPFEPKELVLRLRAILRRTSEKELNATVKFGDFVYDLKSHTLIHKGGEVYLTTMETQLLTALARQAGTALTREALARECGLAPGNERAVDVQINRLRKKIETPGMPPRYVQTMRNEGYRLRGEG